MHKQVARDAAPVRLTFAPLEEKYALERNLWRCSQEPLCRFRRVFLNVRNYVAGLLDHATLDDVAKGLPVARPEVFSPGFTGGEGI